jgi:NRAMP (natural resistance-associated macrophage protein)-like metal ion transporter
LSKKRFCILQKDVEKIEAPKKLIRRFCSAIGPGVITGAADDDPSGIATYSIAGAQLGTSLLWMAWVTWPMMSAVQMMCARIGMVTGRGLASALSLKIPKTVIRVFCLLLFLANTVNIAADFAGMADAMQLLTGINSRICIIIFGLGIGVAIIKFKYGRIANVLKWLALSLFAYVITAFVIHPDWSLIARQAFSFRIKNNSATWETIVAILGTTISPYLFFWQAAQEVEEEKLMGRDIHDRKGATQVEIVDKIMDVGAGTLLSNVVMFFIILTTALTLHVHGISNISSSKEVSEALRPLAGNLATLLYTVGIVAVGFLAIPTLAGSAAYAFAETLDWTHGLDEKWGKAKAFYAVIIIALLIAVALNFININPIKALYWSAVLNGLLAPFLLVGIFLVARDKKIMHGQASTKINQTIVAITTILMFVASVAMFIV